MPGLTSLLNLWPPFGGAAVTPPEPTHPTLLAAVVAALAADATLASAIGETEATPKVFATRAGRGTVAPFVVASYKGERMPDLGFTGDIALQDRIIQVSAYSPTEAGADRLGRLVWLALSPRRTRERLAWNGGVELTCRPGSRVIRPGSSEGRDVGLLTACDLDLTFSCSIEL